jgi:Na+-transporting NADH:ubiquinone oxidoreductase subunit C
MALDKNSNGFTFGFSAVLVIVVGTILATLAVVLKEPQQANLKQEKMKAILMATGVMTADDNMADAPALFEKIITKRLVVSSIDGSIKSEDSGAIDATNKKDAFNIALQKVYSAKVKPIKAKYKKDPATMIAKIKELDLDWPLYVADVNGEISYIIPMEGTGLWGPIWGYVTLSGDLNTIKGVTLAHKGETPGLGAEIATPKFQGQYLGKTIYDGDKYVSIDVLKGGGGKDNPHAVDGITGGTITSVAVGEMFYRSLDLYVPYFNTVK